MSGIRKNAYAARSRRYLTDFHRLDLKFDTDRGAGLWAIDTVLYDASVNGVLTFFFLLCVLYNDAGLQIGLADTAVSSPDHFAQIVIVCRGSGRHA